MMRFQQPLPLPLRQDPPRSQGWELLRRPRPKKQRWNDLTHSSHQRLLRSFGGEWVSDSYCIVQTKDVLPDAALPSSWHWHSFEFEVCPYLIRPVGLSWNQCGANSDLNRIRIKILRKRCVLLFSVVSQPTTFSYLGEVTFTPVYVALWLCIAVSWKIPFLTFLCGSKFFHRYFTHVV